MNDEPFQGNGTVENGQGQSQSLADVNYQEEAGVMIPNRPTLEPILISPLQIESNSI